MNIIENEDYIKVLNWYISWYTAFREILKKEDWNLWKNKAHILFSMTRKDLLIFEGGMSKDHLKLLNERLDTFGKVKESQDHKEIILYMVNVLYSMGF